MKVTLKLQFVKETKGTYVYGVSEAQKLSADGPLTSGIVMQSIYVRKTAFDRAKVVPKAITLTIEAE